LVGVATSNNAIIAALRSSSLCNQDSEDSPKTFDRRNSRYGQFEASLRHRISDKPSHRGAAG
jgi:hypothetical protein